MDIGSRIVSQHQRSPETSRLALEYRLERRTVSFLWNNRPKAYDIVTFLYFSNCFLATTHTYVYKYVCKYLCIRCDCAWIRSNADDFRSIYHTQTRTLSPIKFLYWCHFVSRQYSRKKASAYSWPWPLPNRPWVSVHAIRWFFVRSISRYSLIALLICAFGHQAPPFFSCLILQTCKHWYRRFLPTATLQCHTIPYCVYVCIYIVLNLIFQPNIPYPILFKFQSPVVFTFNGTKLTRSW